MKNFFGLPSSVIDRKNYFENIWKNQVLLSKMSNISLDVSDNFTTYQMELTFSALKDIAKAQDESIKEKEGGY